MNPNNFDIPSVIRLPETTDEILNLLKGILENEGSYPSVVILDMDQKSIVIHSNRVSEPTLSSDSLPFLLSNHTLTMLGVRPSIEEGIKSFKEAEGFKVLGLFINPTHKDSQSDDSIYFSNIVTEGAIVGYLEKDEGTKVLSLINVGEEDEK